MTRTSRLDWWNSSELPSLDHCTSTIACWANADDGAIWEYAKTNGFAIVSRDSDFQDRSVIYGDPPEVIWLRVTNCSSEVIAQLLKSALPVISKFIEHDAETLLILSNRPT